MRLYEKTSNGIKSVDFNDASLQFGKIVFRFDKEGNAFYHYCVVRHKKIRLHTIREKPVLCITPQYKICNLSDKSLQKGNVISDPIRFKIPADFKLTEQQLKFFDLWKKTQDIKKHFAALPSADDTFHALLMRAYHDDACKKMEAALLQCDLTVLQETLSNHWDIINSNALCYTAIPRDPVTILFCDIAECLSQAFKASGTKISAIELLMPTIAAESQFANFPHLTTMRAHDIIRTHILGPKGVYLIPIGILAAKKSASAEDQKSDYPLFDITTFDPHRLISPYYDAAKHDPSTCYLDVATVSRLEKYAPATEILFDAKKQYMNLMDAKWSLLGQLLRFVNLLKHNRSQGGIDSPEEAAKGAFIVIYHFFKYCHQLTEEQKQSISEAVDVEIKTLLDFAMQKQSVLTCVNLTPEVKEKYLNDARRQFSGAEADINNITAQDFDGRDTLGITNTILHYFNLSEHFHIRTDRELKQLLQLEPDEIKTLCEHVPHLRREIIGVIKDLENLVMLIHDNADDRIAALLKAISANLIDERTGIIKTIDDVVMLLQTFKADRVTVILSAVSNQLGHFIKNGDRLNRLLSKMALTASDRTQILNAKPKNLARLIRRGYELYFLLLNGRLTSAQHTQIWNAVENNLARLIKSGYVLHELLSTGQLTEAQRMQIWHAVENNLAHLIKNSDDLNELLSNGQLTEAQRMQIWHAVENHLAHLIKNGYALNKLLSNAQLTEAQRTQILNVAENHLAQLFQAVYPLNDLLLNAKLTELQRMRICEASFIKAGLFDGIKNIMKHKIYQSIEQKKVFSNCHCGLFGRQLTSHVTKLQLYFALRLIEAQYEKTGGGGSAQKLKALIQDVVNATSDNEALQKIKSISFSRSRLANAFALLFTQLETTDSIIIDDVLEKLVTEKHPCIVR